MKIGKILLTEYKHTDREVFKTELMKARDIIECLVENLEIPFDNDETCGCTGLVCHMKEGRHFVDTIDDIIKGARDE